MKTNTERPPKKQDVPQFALQMIPKEAHTPAGRFVLRRYHVNADFADLIGALAGFGQEAC